MAALGSLLAKTLFIFCEARGLNGTAPDCNPVPGSNPAPTQPTQTLSVHTRRWVPSWDGTVPSGVLPGGGGGGGTKRYRQIQTRKYRGNMYICVYGRCIYMKWVTTSLAWRVSYSGAGRHSTVVVLPVSLLLVGFCCFHCYHK